MITHQSRICKMTIVKRSLLLMVVVYTAIACKTDSNTEESSPAAFGIDFNFIPKKEITIQGRTATTWFKRDVLDKNGEMSNRPKRPLLLFLHGFGNEPKQLAQLFGMPRAIDKQGFVLLVPRGTEGTKENGDPVIAWNATERCCGFENPTAPKPDDKGYLLELVKVATEDPKLNVDPEQVYVFGYSNGAFMAHTLVCDEKSPFKGLIAYAGTSHQDRAKCSPKPGLNYLQIHGTEDEIIRYDNPDVAPVGSLSKLWFPPPIQIVKRWVNINKCIDSPKERSLDLIGLEVQPNPNFTQDPAYTVGSVEGRGRDDTTEQVWDQCQNGGKIGFWSINGGSHFNLFNVGTFDRVWDFVSK